MTKKEIIKTVTKIIGADYIDSTEFIETANHLIIRTRISTIKLSTINHIAKFTGDNDIWVDINLFNRLSLYVDISKKYNHDKTN